MFTPLALGRIGKGFQWVEHLQSQSKFRLNRGGCGCTKDNIIKFFTFGYSTSGSLLYKIIWDFRDRLTSIYALESTEGVSLKHKNNLTSAQVDPTKPLLVYLLKVRTVVDE